MTKKSKLTKHKSSDSISFKFKDNDKEGYTRIKKVNYITPKNVDKEHNNLRNIINVLSNKKITYGSVYNMKNRLNTISTDDVKKLYKKIDSIKDVLNTISVSQKEKLYELTKEFFNIENLISDIIINFSKKIIEKEKTNQISTTNVLNCIIFTRKAASIINNHPIVKLGMTIAIEDIKADECPICYEPMIDGEGNLINKNGRPINKLSKAHSGNNSHIFHPGCLDEAIRSGITTCPICRTDLNVIKLIRPKGYRFLEEHIPEIIIPNNGPRPRAIIRAAPQPINVSFGFYFCCIIVIMWMFFR